MLIRSICKVVKLALLILCAKKKFNFLVVYSTVYNSTCAHCTVLYYTAEHLTACFGCSLPVGPSRPYPRAAGQCGILSFL